MTYHKSDFTRIIILSILTFTLSLVGQSVTAQQVPYTFQNGQVIDAEQMNENFASINKTVNDIIKMNNYRYQSAEINGYPVTVQKNDLYYYVKTETGVTISVSFTGEISNYQYIFKSNDCSGEPYQMIYTYGDIFQENKIVNKTTDVRILLLNYNNAIKYTINDVIYKITPQSVFDRHYNNQTSSYEEHCNDGSYLGDVYALPLQDNDPSITGIGGDLPFVITGLTGTDLVFIDESTDESTSSSNETHNVTLNGELIGVTTWIGANNFQVQLTDSDVQMSVNIDNGNINVHYWGSSIIQTDLYYLTNDCSGNGYYRVSGLAPSYAEIDFQPNGLINQNNLYSLSEENYKSTSGMNSRKNGWLDSNATNNCNEESGVTGVFKMATLKQTLPLIDNESVISIEGLEPVDYSNLTEAY